MHKTRQRLKRLGIAPHRVQNPELRENWKPLKRLSSAIQPLQRFKIFL
jgi:hypothetical protein